MTETLKEFDLAALCVDFPAYGLVAGDVGTIVFTHADGEAFEVEFVSGDGETLAVLTFQASQVRPLEGREILHLRGLGVA